MMETERIIIRELMTDDFKGFYDLHNNKNVMNMIPTKILNLEETKEELNKILEAQKDIKNKVKISALVQKINNDFIGTFAVIMISNTIVEIGYRIREKYWRNGFATEVTKYMIDFLFNNTEINEIQSVVDSKNIGSIKVLDKFLTRTKEEVLEDTTTEYSYSITRSQWYDFKL